MIKYSILYQSTIVLFNISIGIKIVHKDSLHNFDIWISDLKNLTFSLSWKILLILLTYCQDPFLAYYNPMPPTMKVTIMLFISNFSYQVYSLSNPPSPHYFLPTKFHHIPLSKNLSLRSLFLLSRDLLLSSALMVASFYSFCIISLLSLLKDLGYHWCDHHQLIHLLSKYELSMLYRQVYDLDSTILPLP